MHLVTDKLPIEPSHCLVIVNANGNDFPYVARYFQGNWVTPVEVLNNVIKWEYVDMLLINADKFKEIDEAVGVFYEDDEAIENEDDDAEADEFGDQFDESGADLATIGERVASILGYL